MTIGPRRAGGCIGAGGRRRTRTRASGRTRTRAGRRLAGVAAARVMAAGMAAALSGCASIVSDNDSTTYVETFPEEAKCELHGQDFTRVVHTPDSIQLPAEAAPVTVACEAPGYRTTTAELDTSMDGWIVGNAIFGGIIGVVIDAARGAGQTYPSKVQVVLEPERFADRAARDEWYDRRRRRIEEKWGAAIAAAGKKCTNLNPNECADEQARLRDQRDAELEALRERRESAVVAGGGPM